MKLRVHLAFLIALLAALPALAADDIALSGEQIKSLGITTAPLPSKHEGEIAGLPAQAVIPDGQMHLVSTMLPATVEQVLAGVGDSVKKGQVLARLQSPALAEAQRGLLETTTQAQLARDNLARDEQLWKDGIISESRYRTTRSQAVAAEAALAERKQLLRLSGMSASAITQLQSGGTLSGLLAVTAPIDGMVLEKTISVGQRLDAASPMFKVARLKPLALEIQAPFSATHGLRTGATVTVPAYGAHGKLIAIGQSLSGVNQTILLRALISEGTENLRAGQFVEASIATQGGGDAQWNIPNSALARFGSKAMVFVETAKGFRAVGVNVLHEGAQSSVINGPFGGNEKIAVSGISTLKASLMGMGRGE